MKSLSENQNHQFSPQTSSSAKSSLYSQETSDLLSNNYQLQLPVSRQFFILTTTIIIIIQIRPK